MICAGCGKNSNNPLCDECYLKGNELFSIKTFSYNKCKICGSSENFDLKLKKEIKTRHKIYDFSYNKKIIGNKAFIDVSCNGNIDGRKKKETKKAIVILTKKMCDNCIKLRGNYYEAVIQVRGENAEKIFIKSQRLLKDKITAAEKTKEGYDIRIIDKKAASAAIKFLRGRHSIKESYKLVGKKKGTELYRNYYAVR